MSAAKKPSKPAKPEKKKAEALPSTIGENPLDLLVPAGAVKHVASKRKDAPAAAHAPSGATSVLTITVPQSLASQVEQILAISPQLSFDQLMSTALAEVLQSIKGRHRGRKAVSSSVKEIATTLVRRR